MDPITLSLYLSLQGGLGHLSGPATGSPENDVNPKGLPYHLVQTGPTARIAMGIQHENVGLEVGYSRLGKSARSLEFTDSNDDTVGEIVEASALDLRAFYEQPLSSRLNLRLFAGLSYINYQRDVWEGHKLVNGKVTADWWYPGVPDSVAWAQWKHSTGSEFGGGGGFGLGYELTKHVELTGEFSWTTGPFAYRAGMAGVRIRY